MSNSLFVLALLVAAALSGDSAPSVGQPGASVVLVALDTSPTAAWRKIQTAAENVYKSCSPGNTVVLVSIRGKRTEVNFSGTKHQDSGQSAEFGSAVKGIKADWFARADLGSALEGPIYGRLLQHTAQKGAAIVLLLTEGDLSPSQARDVSRFADLLKSRHDWPVLVTGMLQKTARELLLAANRGSLHWCSLDDTADNALLEAWIQSLRPAPSNPVPTTTPPPVSPANSQPIPPPKGKEIVAAPSPTHAPAPKSAITAAPGDRTTVPVAPSASERPGPQRTNEKELARPKTSGASPAAGGGSPSPASKKPEPAPPGEGVRAEPAKADRPPVSAGAPRPESSARPLTPGPVAAERPPASAPPAQPKKAADPRSSAREKGKPGIQPGAGSSRGPGTRPGGRSILGRVLGFGGATLLSAFLLLFVHAWFAASNWQKGVQKPLAPNARQERKQPKLLIARVGDKSYCLGSVQLLRSAHIGSSPQNAVRLDGGGVMPRHLRLYRSGADLFARNLGKRPILVNGQQLARRRRCRLTLPAEVRLTENISVSLSLASPPEGTRQIRPEEPENDEQHK